MTTLSRYAIIVLIMEKKKEKRRLTRYKKTVLIMIFLIIILCLPALSPHLCDLYTDNVYGILCDTVSRFTGLFPIALGEILMYIGVLLLLAAVLFLLLLLFLHRKAGYRRFCKTYFKTFSIIILAVILIYIPTWFIPFNCTVLGRSDAELRTDFTYDEVYALLQYFADEANAAAEEIYIAEDGSVEFYPSEQIGALAAEAMQNLGSEFGRLKGYYPPIKNAICSDILERMMIGGYNYPYTLEPTRNRYLSPLYQFSLDAHEYAHHKGYEKENEANFLSQLALSKSSDPYLRLSGFYEMYNYMYPAYVDARDELIDKLVESGKVILPEKLDKENFTEFMEQVVVYTGREPDLSDRVIQICDAGNDIERELYNADEHVIDEMPAVNDLIVDTADQGWEIQGEILQENSYDGVVLLLLQYYFE